MRPELFLLPSYGKETTSARVSGPQSSPAALDPCGAQQRAEKTVTVLQKPPPGAAISPHHKAQKLERWIRSTGRQAKHHSIHFAVSSSLLLQTTACLPNPDCRDYINPLHQNGILFFKSK